jgi:hypothetical protein
LSNFQDLRRTFLKSDKRLLAAFQKCSVQIRELFRQTKRENFTRSFHKLLVNLKGPQIFKYKKDAREMTRLIKNFLQATLKENRRTKGAQLQYGKVLREFIFP